MSIARLKRKERKQEKLDQKRAAKRKNFQGQGAGKE